MKNCGVHACCKWSGQQLPAGHLPWMSTDAADLTRPSPSPCRPPASVWWPLYLPSPRLSSLERPASSPSPQPPDSVSVCLQKCPWIRPFFLSSGTLTLSFHYLLPRGPLTQPGACSSALPRTAALHGHGPSPRPGCPGRYWPGQVPARSHPCLCTHTCGWALLWFPPSPGSVTALLSPPTTVQSRERWAVTAFSAFPEPHSCLCCSL